MADYIRRLRIQNEDGSTFDKQIDYNALANLPSALPANGGTSTKAFQDGNGNVITETYATKKELTNIDLTEYATKTYVDTEIAELAETAPEMLETLKELSTQIEENESSYDALLEIINNKADITYVDNLFNSIINGEEVYY